MLKSQTLAIELSEQRQRINELLAIEPDKLTTEQRSELDVVTKRAQEIEPELRAAITAESDIETRALANTPEDRELRNLLAGAEIGEIFEAVIEHRQTSGRVRELQDHLGLNPNQIPLEMIREMRAVTPAPSDTGASQAAIVMPVFADGDTAFLGVDQRSVPVGDAVFPVLTSRPTVAGPHTDSTSVAETTGAFSVDVLTPGRLQASFFYLRTDAARFAGMSEALRQALNSGLAEAMDKKLIDQIVTDVTRVDATATNTFLTYRSDLIYGNIDGRFANSEGDIRLLTGNKTLEHMASLYRGNTADDSAIDSLRRVSGGIRVSPHIAAVSGNKQDVIVRVGARADAVTAMWQGVTLIPDEITKAATGEIQITAVMLIAFKVVRTGGFKRIQVQHA